MNEAVIYWIFENLDVQNYKFNEIPFVYEVALNVKHLQECLLEKVSFERLGTELDKMFEGNNPQQSVQLLHDFEILQLLYKLPDESKELHDKALVAQLIEESMKMCHSLGGLFKGFKDCGWPVVHAGVKVAENNREH